MAVHQRLKRDTWRLFAASSLMMLLTAPLLWMGGAGSEFISLFLGISLAPVLAIFVGRRQLRRTFRDNPEIALEVHWTFSEEGFRRDGASTHWTGDWTTFNRVVRYPDGLLLWASTHTGYWLPSRDFATAGDVERFETLARANVKVFQDMRG